MQNLGVHPKDCPAGTGVLSADCSAIDLFPSKRTRQIQMLNSTTGTHMRAEGFGRTTHHTSMQSDGALAQSVLPQIGGLLPGGPMHQIQAVVLRSACHDTIAS